jgi:hypothetical protein
MTNVLLLGILIASVFCAYKLFTIGRDIELIYDYLNDFHNWRLEEMEVRRRKRLGDCEQTDWEVARIFRKGCCACP